MVARILIRAGEIEVLLHSEEARKIDPKVVVREHGKESRGIVLFSYIEALDKEAQKNDPFSNEIYKALKIKYSPTLLN